jgi:hypothetical protein
MATCPICRRRPVEEAYKPFCSKRCADVDLQRWFTGGYVIPESAGEAAPEPRDED